MQVIGWPPHKQPHQASGSHLKKPVCQRAFFMPYSLVAYGNSIICNFQASGLRALGPCKPSDAADAVSGRRFAAPIHGVIFARVNQADCLARYGVRIKALGGLWPRISDRLKGLRQ